MSLKINAVKESCTTKLLAIEELGEEICHLKITLQIHCIPAMKRIETACSLFSRLSVPFSKTRVFPQAVQGSYLSARSQVQLRFR